MRVLLDECVPAPLAQILTQLDCKTVQQLGWGGIINGRLLDLAEADFDVFVTADQNIKYEQVLTGRVIGVVELSTNNFRRLRHASDLIVRAIAEVSHGEIRKVEIP